MTTVTFPRERMLAVLWHDEGRVIKDEIYDTSRWSVHHELIFELDGGTYQTTYSVGATECQDERPWEYDGDLIEVTPVHQIEKTVKVWVPVEA